MARKEFVKLHGAGNDFIFLDLRGDPEELAPDVAAQLCDRRFGIGADGVLAFVDSEVSRPRMRIYNSDGSIPEMCGNGLRCFVRALLEHCDLDDNPLPVLTEAGLKNCAWAWSGDELQVSVAMGEVLTLDGSERLHAQPAPELVQVEGETVELYTASTGNPHAVLIGEFSEEARARLGPQLSTHPHFPHGVNVGFLTPRSSLELDLVVHERGAGFTLACGTGAVAATAVAVALGLCPAGELVGLNLPGGRLYVSASEDFAESTLEGPAVEVFRGDLDASLLAAG